MALVCALPSPMGNAAKEQRMITETASPTHQRAGLAPSPVMRAKFLHEVEDAHLLQGPGSQAPVTDADLSDLPEAARRYMRFMGVIGRPRAWSFRARFTGSFRMGPDHPWLPCEAWQYNTRLGIARIFHMRLLFGGLMPVYVRDTYIRGQGR